MEASALAQLLDIVDARIKNGKLSDEEIGFRLQDIGVRSNGEGEPQASNGVGVLSLYGPIFGKANLMTEMSGATSLEMFRQDLNEMLNNDRVHSILLSIDSPGGTSDGVEETAQLIKDGSQTKPIYALADNLAGSAAYWLASQATQVYATPSGAVGSVGAYTVHEDRSVSDAQSGHKYTYISAGPFKTEGNPHQPLSAEGVEYRQEVIDDLYGDFVNAVADGRGISTEEVVDKYGGGRMIQSKKALEAGMIDGISNQDSLINVLSTRQSQPFYASATLNLEHKEMEHSEPGTGVPPAPRDDDEVGDDDKAIREGWRRDTPPAEGNQTKGGEMETQELYSLLGVENDEQLIEAVTMLHEESVALRRATESERSFEQDYPEQYAQMQAMATSHREHIADVFASSSERFTAMVDEELRPTKYGLSALALESVKEAHSKFASGTGTVVDFETAISAIINGGMVEFEEDGSSRESEELTSSTGIMGPRDMFAKKIAEIQSQDELSYLDAMKEAAKRYPDLADAYKASIV